LQTVQRCDVVTGRQQMLGSDLATLRRPRRTTHDVGSGVLATGG
jgi:hypothetical protein